MYTYVCLCPGVYTLIYLTAWLIDRCISKTNMLSQQSASADGLTAVKEISWPPTTHKVTWMNLSHHYHCINMSLGCIFHIRVLMRRQWLQSQCVSRQFCQNVEDFHMQNGANDHRNWQCPGMCWVASNTLTCSSCLAQSTQLSSAIQAISPHPRWKEPSAVDSAAETWPNWKSIYQLEFILDNSY